MAMGIILKQRESATVNKKKAYLAIILAAVITIIETLLLIFDPVFIISKYYARADYGTMLYDALAQQSLGAHVATYLFNVTNADRFRNGTDNKLKVEEVGPFTYQEIRDNDELSLDMESRTMWYSPRIGTRFIPEKSVAHPDDVNVTMPNLAMLSMASKVGTYGVIPRLGFNLLTSRLKSRAIVSMSASKYLWGYDEPLIRLGHDLIPGFVNFDVLGVLDRLYDKKAKYVFELSASDEDKFAIKSVNGVKGLDKWGYNVPEKRTKCNSFINTFEGIAYPPGMTSARSIRMYRAVFCRMIELDYHGTVTTPYGVEALEYQISNRTYQKNNETECLCSRGNCIEGTSDLSPCFLGLPVVLSHAHFWNADPKLYKKIEGLKPDEKKHGSTFVIEKKIGMVLDTQFTVQVSLLLRDLSFNSETKRFSDMLVPVVYFKVIQPPLDAGPRYSLYLMYVLGPRLVLAFQIILPVLAVALLVYSVRQFRSEQDDRKGRQNSVMKIDISNCGAEAPLMG